MAGAPWNAGPVEVEAARCGLAVRTSAIAYCTPPAHWVETEFTRQLEGTCVSWNGNRTDGPAAGPKTSSLAIRSASCPSEAKTCAQPRRAYCHTSAPLGFTPGPDKRQ